MMMSEHKRFSFLESLNEEQYQACVSENSVVLTACPGSGKTRTLTYRLAYLVEKYSNSRKLNIAITYTNRAADEIKERLDSLEINQESIWAGTIHQFCLQFILRPYSMFSDRLKNGFSIIDEYVQKSYLSEICKRLGVKEGFDQPPPLTNPKVKHAYELKMKVQREIDFDMILELSSSLLKASPFICNDISAVLRSIHVDEYQDTNILQYEILADILKNQPNIPIFFVGDTNQAIYGGIGGIAKDANELNVLFNRTFDEKLLNGCYRSTQKLINYYLNFQVSNSEIEATSDWKNESGSINHIRNCHKQNIGDIISEIIKNELDSGIPSSEICVVAPQWWMLFSISNTLRERLPDVNFDAPDITPIKYDPLNVFYLIAKLVFSEMGRNTTRRKRIASTVLTMISDDYQICLTEDFDSRDILKCINSVKRIESDGITTFKNAVSQLMIFLKIDLSTEHVLSKSYNDYLEKIRDRIERYKLPIDITSFSRCFKEKTGITINTCTGVKGEEYTTVIAFGVLNGYLPHWDLIINESREKRTEEAKKLLYVIASRAKKRLFLISEQGHQTKSGNPYTITDEVNHIKYKYDNT